MNVINKIQIKRQQNTEFINGLIQNHRISINEGSSLQQITTPRLDPQQSISSSNMTDQIISMFNQRQSDIHKSDIHKSPSNVYQSIVQDEEQLDTRGQEAEGMINEIDGLLEKIKKKYNMNYPLNEMQQHMQIKTEEEVTQQTQQTETDEYIRNIMNRIQKNDKITPVIQKESFSNKKEKKQDTSDYNLKSQFKDKIYIEHNIHIPRPKSAYQIEQEMEQEQQYLKKENGRETMHNIRKDNINVDEKEKNNNQKTKQNLHELQKKFKEVNKPKINSEEKNKIDNQINDHIDDSNKKNINKDDQNDREIFETPQKQINQEIQSNLSYSHSAVSDYSQSSHSQLSHISYQFTLEEIMANDGIFQSLIVEESKLIVELQILKFKLQEIK